MQRHSTPERRSEVVVQLRAGLCQREEIRDAVLGNELGFAEQKGPLGIDGLEEWISE